MTAKTDTQTAQWRRIPPMTLVGRFSLLTVLCGANVWNSYTSQRNKLFSRENAARFLPTDSRMSNVLNRISSNWIASIPVSFKVKKHFSCLTRNSSLALGYFCCRIEEGERRQTQNVCSRSKHIVLFTNNMQIPGELFSDFSSGWRDRVVLER